ncbi:MAG: bifunctional UDP-N-acetylmuramoyl-tripeptide:D-alanyl-D-alanine ligase/alanine racemase, partial [Bacteroidota bacterium]
MLYPIQKVGEIIQGQFLNSIVQEGNIEYLLTDSRRILFAPNSLFFAFHGMRQDGHQFISKCYEKGVRNFVLAQEVEIAPFPEANFLIVENMHQAIHQLAKFHREQADLQVIGITGSNGKTIVKEWLFQLLHTQFKIVRSPRSYNSQLGVPLSVWQIQEQHDLGIFEAGISKMGEMEKVAPIINCQIGIFTNIGAAHDEGFPDRATKIREKLKLFEHAQVLIYCKDYEAIDQIVQEVYQAKALTWSFRQPADLQVQKIEQDPYRTKIVAAYQSKAIEIEIPFRDEASVENAMHCWLTLLYLGISEQAIQASMLQLEVVEMRLESRKGVNNCLLINDSYNSDLTSLSMALNFLEQQSTHSKHTLILSDILQSGSDKDELYRSVNQLIKEKNIQRFIGVGEEVSTIKNYLPKAIEHQFYISTDQLLEDLHLDNFRSEAILLKGARRFQFERIANRLAERVHQTVLEVNITALLHNLNVFSSYLKPETKLMVMVKAAAYGSGSIEIARLLEFQNVDYLAVAYADEGVELRQAGIQLPIMVLNPEESTFDAHFRYQLEPEIYSISLLKNLIRYLPENQIVPIHLKLETGMNRLGFEEEDLPQLCTILEAEPRLKVQSIFSHLSASEASQEDGFTLRQIQKFNLLYGKIADHICYRPIKHILNTSGIIRFPEHQFDMVRLGVGLYGLDNGKDIQHQLKIVNTLKARISQIKLVRKEETVGYGRKGVLQKDSRIATISIGYADGLPRNVGNARFSLLIRNQYAPIIGNVCMDMCMVDVTHIPNAQEGDEVIVFGNAPHIDDLARIAGTIHLELFTRITQRVKRVYFQ